MRKVLSGLSTAIEPSNDPDARSTGVFLMALWSASILLLVADLALSQMVACEPLGCAWSGLASIHVVMQVLLFLAALITGAAGAGIWFRAEAMPQRG